MVLQADCRCHLAAISIPVALCIINSAELDCCRRKTPAWFGLLRKHAELAVADVQYLSIMRDNCKHGAMINKK